jgi:hypothetical protein
VVVREKYHRGVYSEADSPSKRTAGVHLRKQNQG